MEEINVGIIGCGGFGNFHISNLLTIEGVNIVALVGRNKEKLEETALRIPNVRLYETHHELFEDTGLKLDAVVISVIPALHEDIEKCAVEHGIDMYIEKPIATSLNTARENEKLINASNIICSVGYQARYSPIVQELKKKIDAKKTGLVSGKWIGDLPDVYWWRNKELSGGQIVEQSTHLVDMLRYLFGEVESVYTKARVGIDCVENSTVENSTVEDCSTTLLTFNSGVIATLLTGCYNKPTAKGDVSIQIHNSDMLIEYSWGNSISYHTQSESVMKKETENPHLLSMKRFVEAIRTRNKAIVLSDYSEGLKTLAVTLAANKSMQSGKVEMV